MSSIFKDLSGKLFGSLKVLKRAETKKGHTMYDCICTCGEERTVSYTALVNRKQISCGCYKAKMLSLRQPNLANSNKLKLGEASFNSLFRKYKKHAEER